MTGRKRQRVRMLDSDDSTDGDQATKRASLSLTGTKSQVSDSDDNTDGDQATKRASPSVTRRTKRGKTTPPKPSKDKKTTPCPKKKITETQNELVKRYIKKWLQEPKAPSTTLCKQFLDAHPGVFTGRRPKHTQDKVRGLQSNYNNLHPKPTQN